MENSTQELKVESVSAITKTGVKLNIQKLDKDVEGATITVKDNNGNTVEVTPLNLVINETVADFKFKTPLTSEPTGVWTVEGISYDTDLANKLNAVNAGNTELKLYNALSDLGVKNLKVTNSGAYFTADKPADGFKTLEEVQKFVNEVNSKQLTDAEQAEKVKELVGLLDVAKGTPSQVQVLNALQESFERVNPELIATYIAEMKSDGTAPITLSTTFEQIQSKLDNKNVANATSLVSTAKSTAKRSDYNDAVAAMKFVREDDAKVPTDKVKANLQKDLAQLNLVINVKETSTAAQFVNAYNALVANVDNKATIGAEKVYTDLRTDYMAATNVDATGVVTPANIETAIQKVNTKKRADLFNDVANIQASAGSSQTSTADVLKRLQSLAAYSDKADFDIETVSTDKDSLEAYRTGLAALLAIANTADYADTASPTNVKNAIKSVQTVIDTANSNAIKAPLDKLEKNATAGGVFENVTPANKPVALVATLKEAGLNNVVDANATAYQAVYGDIKSAASASKTTADEVKAVKDAIQKIVNTENARIDLNNASTDTAAQTALTKFAIATNNTAYINLSSTSKLEVAGLVNSNKPANGYVDKASVTSAVSTQSGARSTLISDVNTAPDIATMNQKLTVLNYKPYADLSASQKVAVAEAFLANFPTDKDGVKVAYTTLTNIKADIDKAITAVAE